MWVNRAKKQALLPFILLCFCVVFMNFDCVSILTRLSFVCWSHHTSIYWLPFCLCTCYESSSRFHLFYSCPLESCVSCPCLQRFLVTFTDAIVQMHNINEQQDLLASDWIKKKNIEHQLKTSHWLMASPLYTYVFMCIMQSNVPFLFIETQSIWLQ